MAKREKEKGLEKTTGREVGKNKTNREMKAYPEETGICLPL
jgi:hypothetical protein